MYVRMYVCMYVCIYCMYVNYTYTHTYIQSVCACTFAVHTGEQLIEEASSSIMEQDGTTCMQGMYI